jgi:hypothetical protein
MIPEQLYLTWLGWTAYLVIYLPLTLLVCALIYARLGHVWKSPRHRAALMLPATLIATIVPFWDVFAISYEAQRLCREQAGLKVYRTVEAEGFLGDSGIEIWSKYGFQYVESGGGDKMSRYTIKDGSVMHERVHVFKSRYQLVTGDTHKVIGQFLSKSSQRVIDRESGETLGEIVVFGIFPGRFDNAILALTGTGSGFSPWHCGDEPPAGSDVLRLGGSDVVKATIKPIQSILGVAK